MTEGSRPGDADAGIAEGHDALRINVRLHHSAHGALFRELACTSRGFRSTRAIQLMTIGLMHEGGRAPTVKAPREMPTPAPETPGGGSSGDENGLFVSAVLDSCAGEQ